MDNVIGLFKCPICGKQMNEKWICQDCLILACKRLNPWENDDWNIEDNQNK